MLLSKVRGLVRLSRHRPTRNRSAAKRRFQQSLSLESLEPRSLLSVSLLVSNLTQPNPHILRYDAETGEFRGVYIDATSGGQNGSYPGMQTGADGKLYVCKSLSASDEIGKVQRHRIGSGAYFDTFVTDGSGGVSRPADMHFGPDGKLYILKWSGAGTADDKVLRYDENTGDFLGEFVSVNFGVRYTDMAFGSDGDLYLSEATGNVRRFDGQTGEHLGIFAGGIGGDFQGLVFGPDAHLYVGDDHYVQSTVKRYHGTTGEFMGDFVKSGNGGRLNGPRDLMFGPDGNLYVSSSRTDSVIRYDGKSGDYIDEFISSGIGGLHGAAKLLFIDTASPVVTQFFTAADSVDVGIFGPAPRLDAVAFIDFSRHTVSRTVAPTEDHVGAIDDRLQRPPYVVAAPNTVRDNFTPLSNAQHRDAPFMPDTLLLDAFG